MKTYTHLIISRTLVLKMRNDSDKNCRENQNTNFMFKKSSDLLNNVEKYRIY